MTTRRSTATNRFNNNEFCPRRRRISAQVNVLISINLPVPSLLMVSES